MRIRYLYRIMLAFMSVLLPLGCSSMDVNHATDKPEADLRIAEVSQPSNSDESELLYQVLAAELAGHLGDIEVAVEHYTAASRLSADPQVAERAMRIALYAKDDRNALKAAERWVELAPDNLDSRQGLATLYLRNALPDQAITQFDYVINAAPGNSGNRFLLIGAALAREKDQQMALDAMSRLVERHQGDAHAHFSLANLAMGAKEYRRALAASDRALEIDPKFFEAQGVKARAFMALGETNQALQAMKAAVTSVPESYELRMIYGRMLVQAKRYDAARSEFSTLLKKKPGDADLLYTLGLLNLQEQQYKAAESNFKALLKQGKHAAEGHYYLGRVAEERGKYNKAKQWYLKVSEGDYYLDAQVRIADMYAKLGGLKMARAHFGKVRSKISDDEASVKLYLAEGQLLREASLYHAGMQIYNRALTEHPSNGDLLYARALMAEKIDRIDLLEADLRAILVQDPDNATALNALGYTLADRNERIQEAFQYIERALEVRPDDPTVMDSMGWVHFRMGNHALAEQYLRQAFQLLKDAEIAGHLSEIIWGEGKRSEAREILRRALEKDPKDEYLQKLQQRFSQ
ncbi:MAG: tetratricopeptide repeat protein [Gammaproteobacteria bacterium]|nr:tetratricopeptide repeat protein [Gammaproteobacteria bacterium]